MNPVALRLLNQQLAAPQFSDPADVVAHMGALQAQEYKMMRWAVAMRTKEPSLQRFKEAFDEGRIVRLHLHRGTWQLVSREDYPWMHQLLSGKAETVIRGWMRSNAIDIPEDEACRIRDIIARTAEDLGSAKKEDFVMALADHGIVMDDHRLSYHIRFGELSGLLVSGLLDQKKSTYRLAPQKPSAFDRDEALMLLAKKYFQSHQPATLEDFVWWSGLSMTDCRRGIELLGSWIHVEQWGGHTLYITDTCRTRGARKGAGLLLPAYDEYLIGYKTRMFAIAPEHSRHAYTNNGIFHNVVMHEGLVCGNWTPSAKRFDPKFFIDAPAPEEDWERYQQFLKR